MLAVGLVLASVEILYWANVGPWTYKVRIANRAANFQRAGSSFMMMTFDACGALKLRPSAAIHDIC
jgi:hypothetical protein